MIQTLSIDEVVALVRKTPEQTAFDWKTDFVLPKNDDAKGELIKDIAAIANASPSSYGFLVYGVSAKRPDVIVGISEGYDDARLQELIRGKIEPAVEFLYYEVAFATKVVAVIQIHPTRKRPHVIRVDIGRVRKGQIPIRRGSSTDGVTIQDLFEFFYGQSSSYFQNVISRLQLDVAQQRAWNDKMRILQDEADRALRDMEMVAGLPKGSLG
jgi:predicted HTH transcriptional regulator